MATSKTLFIDANYLYQFTTIDKNVDSKLLIPSILVAQEQYILPIVGTALYNELTTQVSAGTLSSANQTLIDDYVKPCLALYSRYKSAIDIAYKWTAKSIEKQDGDNSTTVEKAELDSLRESILKDASVLADRITRFLIANPTTYPLCAEFGTSFDSIQPLMKESNGGIYFPSSRFGNRKIGYDKP